MIGNKTEIMRKVDLSLIENVKSFVQDIRTIDGAVDVVRGSYCVDGKSILGIMSYDLSSPVDVYLHSDDPSVIADFYEVCDKYAAD